MEGNAMARNRQNTALREVVGNGGNGWLDFHKSDSADMVYKIEQQQSVS